MLALGIVACGDKVWVKAGATKKDFNRDKALCVENVNKSQGISPPTSEDAADPKKFAECMEALGYALEYEQQFNPRRYWRRD